MSALFKTITKIFVVAVIIAALFSIKIKDINIVGNERVSDANIVAKLFEKKYDNVSIVLYVKEKMFPKKKIQFIDSYDIEWINPTKIIVHITEKKAVAFVRRDIKNLYFDSEGIINEISEEKRENAIEVQGVDFKNYEIGEKIVFADSKLLSTIINVSSYLKETNIPANLIEVRDTNKIYVYINKVVVNMGDFANMEVKLQRLNDIYPKIADLSGTLDLSEAKDNMLDEQYIFKKG